MLPCTECTELLLDYLYGLLDEQAAVALRDHLNGCDACQQALAAAKVQQNLLAQAARKYADVPLFVVPADEIATLPGPGILPKQDVATLPFPTRRYAAWKRWAPMAAAAALLLAFGTVYASYQSGLNDHRQALAGVRKEIESLDTKLVSLKSETESETASLTARVQGQLLHVQVLGPANYQPSAANSYRLTTQTPTGQPASAKVSVKLLGAAEQVLFSEDHQTTGDLRFILPAKLPVAAGVAPRLVVETSPGRATEKIEQALAVAEPTYSTHVALNKSTFHGGDTIFFRTLTLDRFALTPVEQPLTLSCTLNQVVNGKLMPIKELHCTTQAGGIAGGEIVLPANSPYGPYVLTIAEVKDKSLAMRSVTRHLMVEPGGKADVIADAKKEAAKSKQAFPLAATRMTADFFPEGGDLIAGMPNRVYYRLQSSAFLPKNLEAAVVVGTGQKQEEIVSVKLADAVAVGGQLFGHFTFTPQSGQSYRFQITAGGKAVDGFPMPPVHAEGVTLSVPTTLVPGNQPFQIKVRSSQPGPVLVVVSCRGHIVDQKIVEASEKPTDVTLEPLPQSHGVLRVTAYEKVGKDWQPAAERLVYRQSTQLLKVSPSFVNLPDKGFQGGDRLTMKIDLQKETDAKTAGWLHALVIDQNALKPGEHEADPLAFFLFGNDMRDPEELEDFLMPDGAFAAKSLDLFLGTQGWRRFASKQNIGETAKLVASRGPAETGKAELFTAGTKSEAVQAQAATTIRSAQEEIVQHANQQRTALLATRESAAARAGAVAATLAEYEQRPLNWLRYGVGATVALLVVIGAVMLFGGLIVALRARSSPRLMLVGSSCALLLGLVLFAATGSLRTGDSGNNSQPLLAWLTPPSVPVPRLNFGPAEDNKQRDGATVSAELYAAVAPKVSNDAVVRGGGSDFSLRKLNAEPPGGGFGGAGGGAAGAKKGGGAKGGGKGGGAPLQKDALPVPGAAQQAIVGDKAMDGKKAEVGVLRQFANKILVPQEMLLWQPNLFAADGTAEVVFDLPGKAATYRVVIYGNTADGRLGVYQGQIDAKK